MGSQHPVRLLVAEDLHHAVSVSVGPGSAVGSEGELSNFVWNALRAGERREIFFFVSLNSITFIIIIIISHAYLLFQLLLVLSNPSHLWVSVDDGGNTVVVDVHSSTSHALHTDDALVLSLVRQHGPSNHVTNGINAMVKTTVAEMSCFISI